MSVTIDASRLTPLFSELRLPTRGLACGRLLMALVENEAAERDRRRIEPSEAVW